MAQNAEHNPNELQPESISEEIPEDIKSGAQKDDEIELSATAESLLEAYYAGDGHTTTLEGEQYQVSSTVSFFGFLYEKVRNAVEFNEEHLIRRLAIQRILKRRLAVNPGGKREGENLARELLWGRYVAENSITKQDVQLFQIIIDSYLYLFQSIKKTHKVESAEHLGDRIVKLMSTEIEESINPEYTQKKAAELYFFYQSLRQKVTVKNADEEERDELFYVAAEKAFARNDNAFILYHLFTLKYDPLHSYSQEEIFEVAKEFHVYVAESRNVLESPHIESLTKFAKKQVAPFKILYAVLEQTGKNEARDIVTSKQKLWEHVATICTKKYEQTSERLRNAAIRSITYIFITKMIFVLILEIPLTQILYGELELLSIGINTLFPPLLMGLIVSFINPPSDKNTRRIYKRIIDLLNLDPEFETEKAIVAGESENRNTTMFFFFSILYLLLFTVVFGFLYLILDELGFNIISKGIFVFFISVVAFFGYRIRQTAKEYVLETKSSIIISAVTFFFLPVLYVGKFFSNQVARINIFIIFFDYLIEAPFKFFFEVIEEWTRFIKARKDELV